MNVRIATETEECHRLWEMFSPKNTLFDLWEFRLPFLNQFKCALHFIVLEDNGEDVGLLPLWYNDELKTYFWMADIGDGCHWPEENSLWVKNPNYADILLSHCPPHTELNSLKEPLKNSERANDKYILDLNGFGSLDDYISSLPKKERSNLRGVRNKYTARKVDIVWDRFDDFDVLLQLNTNRFEDSPFHDPKIVATVKEIIDQGRNDTPYKSHLMTVHIDGELAGVDLIFIFNKTYYPFFCGNNLDRFPGIGHYLNLLDIEDAIKRGMHKIDYLEGDEGSYKEKFFTTVPTFSLNT